MKNVAWAAVLAAAGSVDPLLGDHMVTDNVFWVPQDAGCYEVEGACFVSRTSIGWIVQLAQNDAGKWVGHVDGKYKLHHGGWILLTFGCHTLRDDNYKLTTTFIPLVYLFCRQQETTGSAIMLIDAANLVAKRFAGLMLQPGAGMMDCSAAFMSMYLHAWPKLPLGTCWPHIARKFGQGE